MVQMPYNGLFSRSQADKSAGERPGKFSIKQRAEDMDLTARLIAVLPEQTGQGKNGVWKKQDIIVETEAQYPKKVCISVWGDKIDKSLFQKGTKLAISFDVESREFNGKWYTDVKAWKIQLASDARSSQGSPEEPYSPPLSQNGNLSDNYDSSCPF
jgi:hypothetical protein